jgi:hypothetical protein
MSGSRKCWRCMLNGDAGERLCQVVNVRQNNSIRLHDFMEQLMKCVFKLGVQRYKSKDCGRSNGQIWEDKIGGYTQIKAGKSSLLPILGIALHSWAEIFANWAW